MLYEFQFALVPTVDLCYGWSFSYTCKKRFQNSGSVVQLILCVFVCAGFTFVTQLTPNLPHYKDLIRQVDRQTDKDTDKHIHWQIDGQRADRPGFP